jgi:hypothetical protein
MRWAGHIEHMGEIGEVDTGFWFGDLMKRGHLEDTGLDEMIILK